ncbi:MAG: signal peptidase II [Actinobacteria bacterium]|jgi:signal peptidase II|nr:signal peptidase II [Actinomycetota bacterium]
MWRTLFSVAWFVWILDLATKVWAVSTLSHRPNIKVLGSFFQLTLVRNSGAAFSFATGATIFLTVFAVCVLVAIFYYSSRVTSKGWAVVLGLVMGGIIGNLIDRLFREPGVLRGHVIDWMQLPHWPIFNIADSAIVIAALISLVLTARNISPITKVGS